MMNINEVINTITTVKNANEIIECMDNVISALRKGAQARTTLKRQFGKHVDLCLDTLWRNRLVNIEMRSEEWITTRIKVEVDVNNQPRTLMATLDNGRRIEVANPDYIAGWSRYVWIDGQVQVQRKYYALKEGV